MRNIMMLIALVTLVGMAHADTPVVHPASNDDEPNAPQGTRPYELDWANRDEPGHGQLVDFEDLLGWRVRCIDGAEAKLYRSKQEMCFGEYTGKLVHSGTSAFSRVIIEPPAPIAIPADFTAVNLWVRGNNWAYITTSPVPRVQIWMRVQDANGDTYRIDLGHVDFNYWHLMHRTFIQPGTGMFNTFIEPVDDADDTLDYPAQLTGIEVTGMWSEIPGRIYLDALSFYELAYAPLEFEPEPADLPWPTTPNTILPTLNQQESVRVSPRKVQDGNGFRWEAACRNEAIRVTYVPSDGTLGDLRVEASGQAFMPCWRGGVVFDLGGREVRPGDEGVAVRCVSCAEADGKVRAEWTLKTADGAVAYTYAIAMIGKSLVVDITAEGGDAAQFDIGMAKGLEDGKAVYIPYLTYDNDWPRVVCAEKDEDRVFLLSLLDYYNSDASELFGAPRIEDEDAIGYAGGSVYKKKTDGKRNALRERLFVNISSNIHEVLPNIPNPDCDTGHITRECTWRNIAIPRPELLTKYKAHGIEKFIACHHEAAWSDVGESFTMRLEAAPRLGSDTFAEYAKWQRDLGYPFGTYTNYVDFAPVNSNWNEDDVCLNPDGTWQRAWPRTYAMKPLRGAEKEAYYAPLLHEKYGTTAQYCDVHTAYTPWGRTDYDARTPGAGMFRTQFNAFARLLWNESTAHHGPSFSEGNNHWFYAGIVDGNYATMLPYGKGYSIPPIVDFDLLKMHPKMTDFGMGYPEMFYGYGETWWREDTSRLAPLFDRFHTSTIAFGHIGYLADDWGFDGTLKSYYLVQALQKRYAMIPVTEIAYFNGTTLVDTSSAVISDAYKRGQMYAKYESGLETWCNLSFEKDWTVSLNGKEYQLPPAGFVACRPDDILAYSAVVDGRRHELVNSADYLYMDTRGAFVHTRDIATRGQVAVKPDGDRAWWIIPCTACEAVTIGNDWLGHDAGFRFEATAHDLEGQQVGVCEVRRGIGEVTVMPLSPAMKYRLTAIPDDNVTSIAWPAGQSPTRECLRGGTVALQTKPELQSASLEVPEDAQENERYWFKLDGPSATNARWFDVTVVSPFRIDIPTKEFWIQPGQPIAMEAVIQPATETDTITAETPLLVIFDGPAGWLLSHKVSPVPNKPMMHVTWNLQVPQEPFLAPITIHVRGGEHVSEAVRYLRARPERNIVADLTRLTMTTGMCMRGQFERPLDSATTGAYVATTSDTISGESKPSIYMTPPWIIGVGYSFACIPVELPEGKPQFEFSLGFRAGSSTHDGCLFKAIIIHNDREHEVFAEQYAKLSAWNDCAVDLSAFAGQQVTVKLVSDVGPDDNSYSDWPCWGAPRITLAGQKLVAEVFDIEPETLFTPPEPKVMLTGAELAGVTKAAIRFESAGVDAGIYTSFIDFNGVEIGTVPPSSHIQWHKATIPLTPEALETLRPWNEIVVHNPGGDCMKVRAFSLELVLPDGRRASSWTHLGPWTSTTGWEFGEGISVPCGSDLPLIYLCLPVESEL